MLEAYVFKGKPGKCAAFLVNNDNISNARVCFRNISFELPSMSISILPDCKNEAFNTAKVRLEIHGLQFLSLQETNHIIIVQALLILTGKHTVHYKIKDSEIQV